MREPRVSLRAPRVSRLTDVTHDETERLGKVNTLFKMFGVEGFAQYQQSDNGTRGTKPFMVLTVEWNGFRRHKRFREIHHLEAYAAKRMREAQEIS